MSKRKSTDDVRTSFASIRDLLPQIKHALNDAPTTLSDAAARPSVEQLHRVAALAEDIHAARGAASLKGKGKDRDKDGWSDAEMGRVADELDREGTAVFNMALPLRQGEVYSKQLFAALRLAGFRLIQAGLEPEPNADTLVHLLTLASKVGAALSDAEDHASATRLLSSAAAYEDSLRLQPAPAPAKPGDTQAQRRHMALRSQATMAYYKARMIAAWKEGNEGVAQYMLQKITDADVDLVSSLDTYETDALARAILDIGKALLRPAPSSSQRTAGAATGSQGAGSQPGGKPAPASRPAVDPRRARDAVDYLRRAYALVEKAEERDAAAAEGRQGDGVAGAGARAGLTAVKRHVLRALARAYFLSHSLDAENLVRAETTIDELVRELGASTDPLKGEAEDQTARWMLFNIRRKRKAPNAELEEALKEIVDHTACNETDVKEVVQELRGLPPTIVTAVTLHLLQRALDLSTSGSAEHPKVAVGQALLSLIFHCTRDQDVQRGFMDLGKGFDAVARAAPAFVLDQIPAGACITLLWQAGDRHFRARAFGPASTAFELGAHAAFAALGRATAAKCCRKAAVCRIQTGEFAGAAHAVRRGDPEGQDAGTWYVLLMVAVEQGVEDEAARAAERLAHADGFDQRMLHLAIKMATQRGMKILLRVVLDVLLQALRRGPTGISQKGQEGERGVQSIVLVRCLVRMLREHMAAPGADRLAYADELLRHFKTAVALLEEAFVDGREAMLAKDAGWLWRAAFNAGVDACAEAGAATEKVAALFAVCAQLLELYVRAVIVEAEPDAWAHIVRARFAAVSGRVFIIRQRSSAGDCHETNIRALLVELADARTRIGEIVAMGKLVDAEADIARTLMHTLRVFEAEFLCMLGDWAGLAKSVQDAVDADDKAQDTFEAIADILWAREDCPFDVLYIALEALLHASLDAGRLSVEKFSRWLRVVCTLLLARSNDADRAKAIAYVEQAATVMADHAGDSADDYPVDERQWLLATTYNTGIDCFHASLVDEAKRWIECSMSIARFLPGGQVHAEKISDTYRRILARHQ